MSDMENSSIYRAIYGLTRKLAGTFLAPMIDALIDFSIQRSAERLSMVDFTNTLAKRGVQSWADVINHAVAPLLRGQR